MKLAAAVCIHSCIAGLTMLISCTLQGAHGLSLLITTEIDDEKHTFMFDCGPESKSIDRNVKALAVDLTKVETIALSVREVMEQCL